jgi:hypothetical protein
MLGAKAHVLGIRVLAGDVQSYRAKHDLFSRTGAGIYTEDNLDSKPRGAGVLGQNRRIQTPEEQGRVVNAVARHTMRLNSEKVKKQLVSRADSSSIIQPLLWPSNAPASWHVCASRLRCRCFLLGKC